MKISCVQLDMKLALTQADVDSNYAHAQEMIRKTIEQEKPDVVVLPETWNIGFFPKEDLAAVCDPNGERTIREIGALAKEYKTNIVAGSVGTVRDGKCFNTSYVFDREGNCVYVYDKMHSFSPSGEHIAFDYGRTYDTFQLDGVNCGLIICYDIRFPELTRSITLKGVDVMFVVAQWPAIRTPHIDTLTLARAIENQMFLAFTNSVGTAYGTTCGGSSALIDPWGVRLAHAGDKEEIISADFDLSVIKGIRESINVFRDRKPELYKVH